MSQTNPVAIVPGVDGGGKPVDPIEPKKSFEEIRKDGKATRVNLKDFKSIPMRTFHVTWMTFFMCFFGWFSLAPLLTLVEEDLGITQDQVTTTNQASIGMTIVCRVFIGMICDKFGARRTYSILLLCGAVPVMLVGLVQNYIGLLICRLFIGGLGASFVITQFHTGQMFAPNIIGLANATSAGWGNFGGGVANAVMPHIANLMVIILPFATETNSWRYSSVVASFFLLFNSIIYYKVTKDTPHGNLGYETVRDGEQPEGAEAGGSEEGSESEESEVQVVVIENGEAAAAAEAQRLEEEKNDEPKKSVWERLNELSTASFTDNDFFRVVSDYRAAILVLAYGCCFGVELIMLSQASLYFQNVFGMSKEKAGAFVLAFSAMNLFARSVGGYFSDRFARRGLQWRVYWLSLILCLEGLSIILFSFMTDLIGLIFVLFIFGILTMMSEGGTFGIVPFVNPKCYGLVAGLVGAGGNTGAVLGLFLFQYGIEWTNSFQYLGIIVISVSLLVVLIRFPKPEDDDVETVDAEEEGGKAHSVVVSDTDSESAVADIELAEVGNGRDLRI